MTNWDTAICEAKGIKIHYTRTGRNKPPLILLHGLMTNGLCWTLAHALEKEYEVADQHRKILNMSLDEVIEEARSRHPNQSSETLELFARARLQTSMSAFDVLTPPNPDYRQLVNNIIVPSLLIFGNRGVVSYSIAEELQQINPGFQIEQIQEAGHGLHLDQPELFACVVKTFLHSIDTTNEPLDT